MEYGSFSPKNCITPAYFFYSFGKTVGFQSPVKNSTSPELKPNKPYIFAENVEDSFLTKVAFDYRSLLYDDSRTIEVPRK